MPLDVEHIRISDDKDINHLSYFMVKGGGIPIQLNVKHIRVSDEKTIEHVCAIWSKKAVERPQVT